MAHHGGGIKRSYTQEDESDDWVPTTRSQTRETAAVGARRCAAVRKKRQQRSKTSPADIAAQACEDKQKQQYVQNITISMTCSFHFILMFYWPFSWSFTSHLLSSCMTSVVLINNAISPIPQAPRKFTREANVQEEKVARNITIQGQKHVSRVHSLPV